MRAVFFGILFLISSGLTQRLAYPEPASPESRPILRVDANLVLVPVTVTDSRGSVVPNLNRSDFTLTEEKVRQEIISFSYETAAASVGDSRRLDNIKVPFWPAPRILSRYSDMPSPLPRGPPT